MNWQAALNSHKNPKQQNTISENHPTVNNKQTSVSPVYNNITTTEQPQKQQRNAFTCTIVGTKTECQNFRVSFLYVSRLGRNTTAEQLNTRFPRGKVSIA